MSVVSFQCLIFKLKALSTVGIYLFKFNNGITPEQCLTSVQS